jgi:HD-like signal output (HDOD) protein
MTVDANSTDKQQHEPGGLDAWVNGITDNELPLFAQSLSEISSVASQAGSSAADLARVISMDVSMSVRLLKIANSPVLNPQNRTIDSVRGAVVLMGFDAVRDLAFTLSLVSELHGDDAHPRVVELLAHGFHAACQGQVLALAGKDRSPEEIFVAGLLLNVGEMAFWSRMRPETRDIETRMAQGQERRLAEKAVLGFSLEDLSRRLAEEWRMSGLLRGCMAAGPSRPQRCETVLLGDALAAAVEVDGWDSRAVQALLQQAAKRLDLSQRELTPLLEEGSRSASTMARRFGLPSIETILSAHHPTAAASAAAASAAVAAVTLPAPDPQAELDAVRGVQQELQGRPDIDKLMRLALDGLHDGAAMERAVFAMLSPDRRLLKVRYAVGSDRSRLLQAGQFQVGGEVRSLFGLLLQTGKAIWVDDERRARLGSLIGPDIDALAGGAAFFAMPIFVRQRPVGLLYADRSASARPLDDASFTSFRFFGEQIAAGLAKR